jgi:hypothetical protein
MAVPKTSAVFIRSLAMVINTQSRFIFVHVPKTAGTSVMRQLTQLPGNEIRWLARTKHETLGEFLVNAEARCRGGSQSPADLRDYFRFAFVRNPWDRMASFYRYLVERRPRPEIDTVQSFRDFLHQARDGVGWIRHLHSMRPQLDYFTSPDGGLEMDFVGHFEHLAEDLGAVGRALEIAIAVGHENSSSNARLDYRRSYDAAMIETVATRFQGEIDAFGYVFDRAQPGRRCSGPLARASDAPRDELAS